MVIHAERGRRGKHRQDGYLQESEPWGLTDNYLHHGLMIATQLGGINCLICLLLHIWLGLGG